MKRIALSVIILIFASVNFVKCDEIDLERIHDIFIQMFGEKYEKVTSTASKSDDESFAEELITSSKALSSNPELQLYMNYLAAQMLKDVSSQRIKARDIFLEIRGELPESLQNELSFDLLDLQKKIIISTPKKNKLLYATDVETYASLSQEVAYDLIKVSDYNEAIKILKDALRYVKTVDNDAAKDLNDKINIIQNESKRFYQIQSLLTRLETNPDDERANVEVSHYYLFERNSLFKAWPYLEKVKDDDLSLFFNSARICIGDQLKKTPDGIDRSLIPLVSVQPAYILDWLSKKKLEDNNGVIAKQIELLKEKKKVSNSKIVNVIKETSVKHGILTDVPYKTFITLAESIDKLMDLAKNNKKLSSSTQKLVLQHLVLNKFIAVSKANIKITRSSAADEVDKLKLELEVGKVKMKMKELEVDEFEVVLDTPFVFQKDSEEPSLVEINGGGVYTFTPDSWAQFAKDFDVTLENTSVDLLKSKDLFVKNGCLIFNNPKGFHFKAKKKKWSQNMEVTFELFSDYDFLKQSLDYYFLFKPDSKGYKQIFGVYYHFFRNGGWFGIIKEGENFDNFNSSKLTKRVSPDSLNNTIWKEQKVTISAIVKDKNFSIILNGETLVNYPLTNITNEKNFPSEQFQIYFIRRPSAHGSIPVRMDNLYIGPVRPDKK